MCEIRPITGGGVTTAKGFLAGAASAGIKSNVGALDVGILYSERECSVAGVFTTNRVRSAPVPVSQRRVKAGGLRGVVVNSGCANALTGKEGTADAEEMAALAARKLGLRDEEMAVASTGITGVRLPMVKVRAGIQAATLGHDGLAFARAIMTTDTVPKEAAVAVGTPSDQYHIGGCAKGSGMIEPNMATMLAYVTTDVGIERDLLQTIVRDLANETFNMLSVDGDTSCSDTLLVFANGASGARVEAGSDSEAGFQQALRTVFTELVRQLARDGEGAKHLIEVRVSGAASAQDARLVAKTVASSSLVKTAVAGCDPNWGRILVAAGRSGAEVDEGRTTLSLQGELLFERGKVLPFDEAAVRSRLEAPEVMIGVDLGIGEASAKAWGCDLTTDYVHINADYTT